MLAEQLFREVTPAFFGVLASPNARIYLDVFDELERVLSSSGSLSYEEAQETTTEVLRARPEFSAADEFPDATELATLSGQASLVLRRLFETGWLHMPPRSDWRRIVTLNPNGEILLAALRQIARGEPAQFTDKIQVACGALLNPDAFTEQPYSDLEGCLDNLRRGLRELRQMETSIARHTRHLLAAQTLRENLAVLYDEFSENIGHACYRELVRSQLPTRLLRARRRLDSLLSDEVLLEKMQRERLQRAPQTDATSALNEVRLKLDEFSRLLDSIEPQADEIDRRAAEFARRSFARFRYLQEMAGGWRDKVQDIFDWVQHQHVGRRFSDLDESSGDPPLPELLIPDTGLLSGDSLFTPRLRRSLAEIEPIGDDISDEQRDAALAEMEANLRDSLHVSRANRFVEELPGGSGARFTTAEMPIRTDDDLADVIACLLHADSRDAQFAIHVPRVEEDLAASEHDRKAGMVLERFVLEKR